MQIDEVYRIYPDLKIIHGISRKGQEALLPEDITLIKQIEYIINPTKLLSCQSFIIYNKTILFSPIGVILKDGNILRIKNEDLGGVKEPMTKSELTSALHFLVQPPQNDYNEVIVISPIIEAFYICKKEHPLYSSMEIYEAAKHFKLLILFITDNINLKKAFIKFNLN